MTGAMYLYTHMSSMCGSELGAWVTLPFYPYCKENKDNSVHCQWEIHEVGSVHENDQYQ
jgi:hypothetical protein